MPRLRNGILFHCHLGGMVSGFNDIDACRDVGWDVEPWSECRAGLPEYLASHVDEIDAFVSVVVTRYVEPVAGDDDGLVIACD